MLSQLIRSGPCATETDRCSSQWRRPTPVPDLHVHQLHGRLRPGHHARDQFALRCRLLLHQRMATDRQPARTAIAPSAASCPPSDTPAYWRAFNDRVLELWQKYDAIAKEKKPDSFFFANLGGNVRCGPNLDRLGKLAPWFQADNQGRTYDDPAVWGCTLQGRVVQRRDGRKIRANVTAAYSTGVVRWRNGSKNPDEATHVVERNLAGGMVALLPLHRLGSRLRRRSPLAEGRR